MSKFKCGDSVRVIATPSRHFDSVGTVDQIQEGWPCAFGVAGLEDAHLWFYPDELILAENGVVGA